MKVLVTGGAGFIASHITDKLIEQGHDVVCVDNLSTGTEENINPQATFYKEDITSDNIREIFIIERPECVIHHAAQIDVQKSIRYPVEDAKINILGTINILESCKEAGTKKIIYASSAAVYGDPQYLGVDEIHSIVPLSHYGISKYTPEHYIKAYEKLYGLRYTILRYANVYGTRQISKGEGGVISIFVENLLNNNSPIIFGDGEQTRDFIYVEDIAAANVAALTFGDNFVLNVSTNERTSINQLVYMLNRVANTELPIVYREARNGDIVHSCLDNTLAKSELKWAPKFTLKEGLQKTVSYYVLKRELQPQVQAL
ncbi:NAD-dependent epimerase/dehydratase family protein [Paenibacillus chitinolyticus]|uniref:NAD-dependent epimerase/dehydratase family protein n=1 Tax=Paenibacillus chitinolyticus TaxID=79263 RepID=UPI0026E4AD78|nr:NAD-dependent epimerase/dehydratase family protein [Paenibacillus chitinolyticus]GKS10527.1 UDP-glucose 4-epimerase [Paenibacillus chitinolyticus]